MGTQATQSLRKTQVMISSTFKGRREWGSIAQNKGTVYLGLLHLSAQFLLFCLFYPFYHFHLFLISYYFIHSFINTYQALKWVEAYL